MRAAIAMVLGCQARGGLVNMAIEEQCPAGFLLYIHDPATTDSRPLIGDPSIESVGAHPSQAFVL